MIVYRATEARVVGCILGSVVNLEGGNIRDITPFQTVISNFRYVVKDDTAGTV
jgi:hypothetical protein